MKSVTRGVPLRRSAGGWQLARKRAPQLETLQPFCDLGAGEVITQQYSLNRNLHCWRLEFMRTISNVNAEFGFRLYLLSMPDVKLTRGREGMMGSVSGLTGGFF